MKLIRYIFGVFALLAVSACSDNVVSDALSDDNGDGTFTMTMSVDMPQMSKVNSRAMSDKPTYDELSKLKLYLVEFEMNSATEPTANFLKNVYEPTEISAGADRVNFKVQLNQAVSGERRVLHLIAVPEGQRLTVGGNDLMAGGFSGSEAIVAQMTTSDGNEAYWQRVEFPDGYGTRDVNGNWATSQSTKDKLTRVPMIRNYAQVKVVSSATGFSLSGYEVINVARMGTVAPWDAKTHTFPAYLNGFPAAPYNGVTQKPYADLTYGGIFPGDPVNDIDKKDVAALTFDGTPKFIYERPLSNVNSPTVIVKGRYNNKDCYYKIDLGQKIASGANQGKFERFNILRNFRYVITVKSVASEGYSSAEAAYKGVVYNNLSFDVDTEEMLNISDGKGMMWVNFTKKVVTETTTDARTIYWGYKFRPDLVADSYSTATVIRDDENNGKVIQSMEAVADNASLPEVIKAEIQSKDLANWHFYKITTVVPTDEQKRESITIIDPATGLARTSVIVCRTPWRIWRNRVFAGNYNLREDFPYGYEAQRENKVKSGTGQPLTVFFVIPEGLDKALFPLDFIIESDKQDVENNPVGTLVVRSGESLFDKTKTTISYVKTITWTDYNSKLTEDNPTGTEVTDEDKKTPIHRIRCRLRTINTVTSATTTRIRIYNPYFELQDANYNKVGDGTIEVSYVRDPSADSYIGTVPGEP